MRKRILLTGAGGTMGGAALQEILRAEHTQDCEIVVFDLSTRANRRKLNVFARDPRVEIFWGDLTCYDDVLRAVSGVDIVLHAAAFISPAADHDPERAWRVNAGSAVNLVRAIKAQPNADAIKLVSVGTVAATGDRLPPIHVGRTGDPLKPSIFDMYACSKIAAERTVAESGLKYWVSLRQTFITTPNMPIDPIMFHQPLQTCIEFCTARNAGLLLANICREDLPQEFWRRFYNIGGGERARVTYMDFMRQVLRLSGIEEFTQLFDRNWFASRNFHCHWFEDSHILNHYLDFQQEGMTEFLADVSASISWWQRLLVRISPASMMRKLVFEPLAQKFADSTQYWIEHDMSMRISAFYGSHEAYEAIPGWDEELPDAADMTTYTRLDHGYDESKPTIDLDLADMQTAARFRGGECLTATMQAGGLFTPLRWRCAFGHEFAATGNLVLKGGHWCPQCMAPPWNYAEQARRNPFFAQVWYPNHSREENHFYPEDCWMDVLPKSMQGKQKVKFGVDPKFPDEKGYKKNRQ